MDPIVIVLQALFYGVFAVSLYRYARRRGPLELAVVMVFAPMAALFASSALGSVAPDIQDALRPVTTTILLLQPVMILRLASTIRPLGRWVMPAVWVGFAINVAWINLADRSVPSVLAYVGFFFAVEAAAGVRFLQDARRRVGLARLRLSLAGLATILFGLCLLIAGAASAAAGGGGQTVAGATAASRVIALVAGLGYLAAFLPPRWVRRIAQRSVAFDVTRRLVVAPSQSSPELLWSELARAAMEILGARSIDVRADGRPAPLATIGEADLAALLPRPAESPSAVTRLTIPIHSQAGWRGTLIADIEGRPLFVEDDVALLEMLGSLTAHTVERLDAFIKLEEAQRTIAEAAAIRKSEARFRALLDADPNAILALDNENRITWATRQAGELFGYAPEELAGVSLNELVPVPGGPLATVPETLGSRQVLRAETTARRRDGTHFPAEIAQTEFELDGQPFHVAIVSDVSWRHEADQMRERFVGVLSHELRTPVTSIYGGAQLLTARASRLNRETRTELLHTIADESERLQRIIENLVILARIERGADLNEPRPVLLERLLRDLIARERNLWPTGTIQLVVPGALPVVAADDDHLAQIMRNLLSNAAKYAGEGATVTVDVREEAGGVTVRVLDNGPGIPVADPDRLFSLYYRARDHAAVSGAGMGLFVCRQLVQAMGGRIWARPRPEGGSEFGFSLPVYADDDLAIDLEDAAPATSISGGGSAAGAAEELAGTASA